MKRKTKKAADSSKFSAEKNKQALKTSALFVPGGGGFFGDGNLVAEIFGLCVEADVQKGLYPRKGFTDLP